MQQQLYFSTESLPSFFIIYITKITLYIFNYNTDKSVTINIFRGKKSEIMVIHYKDKEFFNGHDLTLSVDRRKLENSNYMDFVTPFTFKMK